MCDTFAFHFSAFVLINASMINAKYIILLMMKRKKERDRGTGGQGRRGERRGGVNIHSFHHIVDPAVFLLLTNWFMVITSGM